jgi:isopenicillin N synthase-like dioxygenase
VPVTNHGVPEDVIARAQDAMRGFFELPLETKMKVSLISSQSRMPQFRPPTQLDMRLHDFRGYNPLYSAKNDSAALKPDAHEGFEFGYEDLNMKHGAGVTKNKVPNVWPEAEQLPDFREAMLNY